MSFMPSPGSLVRMTDGRTATVVSVTPDGSDDRVRFEDGHEEHADAWKIAEVLKDSDERCAMCDHTRAQHRNGDCSGDPKHAALDADGDCPCNGFEERAEN